MRRRVVHQRHAVEGHRTAERHDQQLAHHENGALPPKGQHGYEQPEAQVKPLVNADGCSQQDEVRHDHQRGGF